MQKFVSDFFCGLIIKLIIEVITRPRPKEAEPLNPDHTEN